MSADIFLKFFADFLSWFLYAFYAKCWGFSFAFPSLHCRLGMFGADPERIGLLENPQQQSIRSPPRASSRTRLLRSPHANAGMKQYECSRKQPLFRAGHDRGINKWSKPKGLRQY